MNLKQKIALADLAKKVERGIISQEKGKQEFERITGRNADAVPIEGEDDELTAQVDSLAKTQKPKKVVEKKSKDAPFSVATADEVVSLLQQLKVQGVNPDHQDRIDTERVVRLPE